MLGPCRSLQIRKSGIEIRAEARAINQRRFARGSLTARGTMQAERRCVQRKRPGGISYFEFEAGCGGIVLDASEKGLRFQAADAVHQLGPSRIWISPRPEERIEATGDVVWKDRSKKTGGLGFIYCRLMPRSSSIRRPRIQAIPRPTPTTD